MNSDSAKKILFSTGLGVNKSPGLALRFGAYLLPLVDAVRSTENSRGRFYIADQAAKRIGQPSELVESNVELMQMYFSSLMRTLFPELEGRIEMVRERSEESLEVLQERNMLRDRLIALLLDSEDEKILTFARKRVNPDDPEGIKTPLGYMAEHSLFMRDPIVDDERLFLIDSPEAGFERFAMIGGPAEEIFFRARQLILGVLNPTKMKQNLQLFSDVGRLPPYYSQPGEPLMGDVIETNVQKFLADIRTNMNELTTDFFALLSYLSGAEDFSGLQSRKKAPTPSDYQSLQKGMERFQLLINTFNYANV